MEERDEGFQPPEVLLETRSTWVRGVWAWLGSFAFLVLPALVLLAEELLLPAGVLLGLAVLAVLRLPGQRLELRTDGLARLGPTGRTEIGFDDVEGLGCRRGSSASEPGWENHAVLRTRKGDVPLHSFQDHELVWTWVAERVLPRLVDRHVEALRRGETVALQGLSLDPEGFTLRGVRYWWRELDGVSWSRDGLLVTFVDRPQDAVVAHPSELPSLPTFLGVAARMIEEQEEAPPPGPRERGGGRPLRGLPRVHDRFGELVFTRTLPLSTRVLSGFLGLAGLALLGGGVAWFLGVPGVGQLAPAALGLFVVGLAVFGWLEPPGGDAFSVYERGLVAPGVELPLDEVEDLRLQATEHYTNGVYQYTTYDVQVRGGDRELSVSGFGPQIQAYYKWFQEALSPVLAGRALERLEAGEVVDFGFARLAPDALEWGDGGSLPWDAYSGHALDQGILHVFSDREDHSVLQVSLAEVNAHVFYLILQLHESALREAYEEWLASQGKGEGKKDSVPDSGGEES